MTHETALLATIAVSLGFAFLFGFVAARLRAPPLVGYLLAGVAVGPFTPGFVANAGLASELAGIGVILLMFGVGLHFSIRDLLAVRAIALPGAIAQIAAATVLGAGLAMAWGWSAGAGLVFGLASRSRAQWCCCGRWRRVAGWRRATAGPARSRAA